MGGLFHLAAPEHWKIIPSVCQEMFSLTSKLLKEHPVHKTQCTVNADVSKLVVALLNGSHCTRTPFFCFLRSYCEKLESAVPSWLPSARSEKKEEEKYSRNLFLLIFFLALFWGGRGSYTHTWQLSHTYGRKKWEMEGRDRRDPHSFLNDGGKEQGCQANAESKLAKQRQKK